jgi:putative colanic acid biosynthesis acetyltransferase WcaF
MITNNHPRLGLQSKFLRFVWTIFYYLFFRFFPSKIFRRWRNLVLILFGAKIGRRSDVYCSASIWAPWNLVLGDNACIGPNVTCYNVDIIELESNVTVSQNCHLCTASHDIYSKNHELVSSPIILRECCWIGADAFINKGVIIGEGAVVAARSYVYKCVEPWAIVGGNPSVFIKRRSYND